MEKSIRRTAEEERAVVPSILAGEVSSPEIGSWIWFGLFCLEKFRKGWDMVCLTKFMMGNKTNLNLRAHLHSSLPFTSSGLLLAAILNKPIWRIDRLSLDFFSSSLTARIPAPACVAEKRNILPDDEWLPWDCPSKAAAAALVLMSPAVAAIAWANDSCLVPRLANLKRAQRVSYKCLLKLDMSQHFLRHSASVFTWYSYSIAHGKGGGAPSIDIGSLPDVSIVCLLSDSGEKLPFVLPVPRDCRWPASLSALLSAYRPVDSALARQQSACRLPLLASSFCLHNGTKWGRRIASTD